MSKPGTVLQWSTGGVNTPPAAGLIASGYASLSIPTFDNWNYMWNLIGQWISWLNIIDSTAIVRSPTDSTTVDLAIKQTMYASDFVNDFVVTGGTATTAGTLSLVVSAVTAVASSTHAVNVGQTLALPASKDNYLDLSNLGVFTVVSVTNGAGAPGVTANSIRLLKAVTSVGAITSVTDLRQLSVTFKSPMVNRRTNRTVTAAGAITVLASDDIINIARTAPAPNPINLPAGPVAGDTYTFVDCDGSCNLQNQQVTPAAGLIMGQASINFDVSYGSMTVYFNGTNWSIL